VRLAPEPHAEAAPQAEALLPTGHQLEAGRLRGHLALEPIDLAARQGEVRHDVVQDEKTVSGDERCIQVEFPPYAHIAVVAV